MCVCVLDHAYRRHLSVFLSLCFLMHTCGYYSGVSNLEVMSTFVCSGLLGLPG